MCSRCMFSVMLYGYRAYDFIICMCIHFDWPRFILATIVFFSIVDIAFFHFFPRYLLIFLSYSMLLTFCRIHIMWLRNEQNEWVFNGQMIFGTRFYVFHENHIKLVNFFTILFRIETHKCPYQTMGHAANFFLLLFSRYIGPAER